MTNNSISKVRENRLRREADRQGLSLIKSRRRDPRAYDYGKYTLQLKTKPLEAATAVFEDGQGISLDAVEAFLYWDDIFIVPPGTEELGAIDYPQSRAILTYIGGIGWQLEIVNDGDPIDYRLGVLGADDVNTARVAAERWIKSARE